MIKKKRKKDKRSEVSPVIHMVNVHVLIDDAN